MTQISINDCIYSKDTINGQDCVKIKMPYWAKMIESITVRTLVGENETELESLQLALHSNEFQVAPFNLILVPTTEHKNLIKYPEVMGAKYQVNCPVNRDDILQVWGYNLHHYIDAIISFTVTISDRVTNRREQIFYKIN